MRTPCHVCDALAAIAEMTAWAKYVRLLALAADRTKRLIWDA